MPKNSLNSRNPQNDHRKIISKQFVTQQVLVNNNCHSQKQISAHEDVNIFHRNIQSNEWYSHLISYFVKNSSILLIYNIIIINIIVSINVFIRSSDAVQTCILFLFLFHSLNLFNAFKQCFFSLFFYTISFVLIQ